MTCVFSTYCIFVQTVQYHKVFEMNLGNEPFLCIPLWCPFLFFSSSKFQLRLGTELSKDNRVIYSFKILLYFILFHIELQWAGNVRFGHLRGKDRGILKSVDHFSELHGNYQHSDVDLLLFPRRIFKSLWLESQSLVFLFYATPSNSHFPPHILISNWFYKYHLTFNGCNFCYWQILKYFIDSS